MEYEWKEKGIDDFSLEILRLYDSGDLSMQFVKRLLLMARRSTFYFDGTENAALRSSRRGGRTERCGQCLKRTNTLSLTELIRLLEDRLYERMNDEEDPMVHDCLCRECWIELLDH